MENKKCNSVLLFIGLRFELRYLEFRINEMDLMKVNRTEYLQVAIKVQSYPKTFET